ncbi:MAG: DUF2508 family protein [Acutalibacteraceae bacterium]
MKLKSMHKKRKYLNTDEETKIISEIQKLNSDLEKAYESFQNQTDDDLLEASIYKIKELRARHNYLIKLARKNKIEASYMKFQERVSNA